MDGQNKVREAVLKVFRSRISSPGGGPAIVLPADTPTGNLFSNFQPIKTSELLSSEDEIIIVDKRPKATKSKVASHKSALQKEKRRKSRGDRNKGREQKNQSQVDHRARAEFRKHVKRAEEIVSKSKIGRQTLNSQSHSAITQSRLTRRLGLYNQGKKSDRVLRDLTIPETIQKQTEEDLRRILSTSNETANSETEPQLSNSVLHSKNMDSCQSNKSHPRSPVSCKDASAEIETNRKQTYNKSPPMPETPDLNSISEQLCNALDLSYFPGRDLFSEIQAELVRTLRINSRMTPSKSTPAIKRQARNTQSAKRSLQSVFPSSTEAIQYCDSSYSSHTGSHTSDTVNRKDIEKLQTSLGVNHQYSLPNDHTYNQRTRQIPCTQSRPDDEKTWIANKLTHHSLKSCQERLHEHLSSIVTDPSVTLLDIAEQNYAQEETLADFSMSGLDVIRNAEKMALAPAPRRKTAYASSLDMLDQIDQGPLHSKMPYEDYGHLQRHLSDVSTTGIFHDEHLMYPNPTFNASHVVPHCSTRTEDLFHQPINTMTGRISPGDICRPYDEIHRRKHHYHRRCKHASDSDDSPVLCYKCLDPIKMSPMDVSHTPKFHPQKMY